VVERERARGSQPLCARSARRLLQHTPLDLEDVTIDYSAYGGSATFATKGYHVKVGETRSFSVGFYSEGPTTGVWDVSVAEGNPLLGGVSTSRLSGLGIAPSSGKNGDKATVTVTVDSAGTKTGSEFITIVSTLGTTKHFMPILIASQ
jgi:hypothetical protein